jgi:hypothetical protein
MDRMFSGAISFNQYLRNWNVSSGPSMVNMFEGAPKPNMQEVNKPSPWNYEHHTEHIIKFIGDELSKTNPKTAVGVKDVQGEICSFIRSTGGRKRKTKTNKLGKGKGKGKGKTRKTRRKIKGKSSKNRKN